MESKSITLIMLISSIMSMLWSIYQCLRFACEFGIVTKKTLIPGASAADTHHRPEPEKDRNLPSANFPAWRPRYNRESSRHPWCWQACQLAVIARQQHWLRLKLIANEKNRHRLRVSDHGLALNHWWHKEITLSTRIEMFIPIAILGIELISVVLIDNPNLEDAAEGAELEQHFADHPTVVIWYSVSNEGSATAVRQLLTCA